MKQSVEHFFKRLLGSELATRWVDANFPFTHPSWELEICVKINDGKQQDKWMEMLGCGIVAQTILDRTGHQHQRIGWALGLGIERLAMLFYHIPDIRLFWTHDTGFTKQWTNVAPFDRIVYKPISAYPQNIFDISFWLPDDPDRLAQWSPNDVHAIILEIGGELVEQVYLMDQFRRPRDGRQSNMYRIVYRSMERRLSNEEVNHYHKQIEQELIRQLCVEIR